MNILLEDFNRISKKLKNDLSLLNNKRILLIGATGAISSYLGKFLIYLLARQEITFHLTLTARSTISLDKYYSDSEKKLSNVIFLDVREPFQINDEYDFVIFAAGNADPNNIMNNPLDIIDTNYRGLYNTLNFLKFKKSKIIFFSTREIYGLVENRNLIEEDNIGIIDPLNFRSCYPEVKKLCENMLECAVECSEERLSYSILRLAHIYGPGMNIKNDGRIMNDLVEMAISGRGIKLMSDGYAVRAFCYISDAIVGIIKAMVVTDRKSVFNIANENEPKSIREIVELFLELFPELIPSVEYTQLSNANTKGYFFTNRIELSTKRLEQLGWKPEVSLKEGIEKTVLSYLIDIKG